MHPTHRSVSRKVLNCRTIFGILLLVLIGTVTGCGVSPNGVVQVSSSSFDFGQVSLSTRVRRIVVTLSNPGNIPVTLSRSVSGSSEFILNEHVSCPATLAAGGSCSMVFTYTPSTAGPVMATLALTSTSSMKAITRNIAITGTGVLLSPGQSLVTGTNNPLVASYFYYPTSPGAVSVEFGPDTNYGRKTWSVHTPVDGGPVALYVAGMQQNTTYHMRALFTATDGSVTTDMDHTFTTGSFDAEVLPKISVTTSGTPQPGIELEDSTAGTDPNYLEAYATDLNGNLIWGYDIPDRQSGTIVQPIKLLPNGHFLMILSYNSQSVATDGPPAPGTLDVLREIDLAGNPVREISANALNAKLAAAGYNLTIDDFHHDVAILPNGHWVVIGNTLKQFTNLAGNSGAVNVAGDVLIDLDTNLDPVWVWNEFDHLDVNRHPVGFPDWTHTNAVLYSPDDGNLLVSMRHQSWIVKVDYQNGKGTGNILWKLGEGGDFALTNGADPVDWFYGQHQPSFVSSNTAGTFQITMMDNGYNRILSDNSACDNSSCYTTIPVLSVNESAKTASFTFHDQIPQNMYSFWGGGTTALANGNIEFDLCNEPNTSSMVEEVAPTSSPQTVWTMTVDGENLYRSNRIPSLYPGVQW